MDDMLFVRGLIIGLSIAAPVGPIGVLCIRRTLADGHTAGLVSGLGAATADAVYGCIAGFGLTLISSLLLQQQLVLSLFGGAFLCYLGYTTYISIPAEHAASAKGGNLSRAYLSTFALTLTNPMTILSFIAIFAGLGLAQADGSYGAALWLVAGVFGGSALWWLMLSSGASLLRTRLTMQHMRWINRLSGVVIGEFGLLSLLHMV
jgi:threonine/homoserine/homoserine lactone efflux protein